MISELKYKLFISLAEKAKLLPKRRSISHVKKKIVKSFTSIRHLTLKNQRRIKRLRFKKESDKDIVKLLRQEAREHKLTRDQLQAAIQYLKHEHSEYKETVKKNTKRQKILAQLKTQLDSIKTVIITLATNDPKSIELQAQVVRLDKLIKKKEAS